MKRLLRDSGRTLLVILLIACAAAIAGLGATVHVFTLQQINAVERSTVTMAVKHVHYPGRGAFYLSDAVVLETLNAHSSVKIPALTNSYWCIDASVTPAYSGQVEGGTYSWSRDDEIAHTVMTVTCTEDLGKDPYSDNWYSMARVDEVHLEVPYDIPETIKIIGISRGTGRKQVPLVPGESYLLCGTYEDIPWELDWEASFAGAHYDPVYAPLENGLASLRLAGWQDQRPWMKHITAPDDVEWLNEAVHLGDMMNRSLRLDCINDLNRLRWFANGRAIIVEGRSFTEEEQALGAKVCLISQALAKVNGLKVGDTISMTAYAPAMSMMAYYEPDMLDMGYEAVDIRTALGEQVTFEIIGIYNAPLYKNTIDEFVPNTVIAPYHSMQLDLGRRYCLPVQTQNFILHNGQGDAFLQAVRDAGYPDGLYTIEETNYEVVEEILAYMSTDSLTLLAISASVGAVMLIVVLALYARGWHKENAILAMLGTTKACIGWRMLGSLTVLTLLGSAAAFGGMCAVKSYIEEALNSVYIGSSSDFSAIRVGAFSEEGMTIGVEVIAAALGLTAVAFLLIAAVQSIISARKKVRECLFD